MTHGRFIVHDAERQAFAIVATALGTIGGSALFPLQTSSLTMATNNPRHGYERKRSQLKTKTMRQKHGRNVVARLANLWIRRKPGSSSRFVGKRATDSFACMMPPVITSIKFELRSKGLDRRQCCWHVSYQFCDLSAEISVYAENEAEARAQAVRQLRRRGLKVE